MRARRLWFGLLGTLVLAGLPARAGAQALGSEFQINTYTTNNQEYPSAAADANGNFVVVWDSDGQDGSANGVVGQRYDSVGNPLGNEFQVNTYTTANQLIPSVAADSSGNFVIVWDSDGQDGSADGIFGQRFNSGGDRLGREFQVNSYTVAWQQSPAVASDASGNFVVVWNSSPGDGDGWGVFGQRFDSAGVPRGDEFQVNTYTGWHQWREAVTSDASGNFVVAWQSLLPGSSGYEIMAQRYDSDGAALGGEFRVNSSTAGNQRDPAVASDPSGNFIVVWQGGGRVVGQRYDSGGAALGAEFVVSSQHWVTYAPSVAADASGNFVVVWWHIPAQGSNVRDVFGRRYDNGGEPVGVEFRVNSYTTDHQQLPAVAAAGNDQFVVAWNSVGQDGGSWGVFGQRFGFSGDISTIHVGDLDGRAKDVGASWLAQVKTLIHDDRHRPLGGALVTLYLTRVGTRTCTTTAAGQCEINETVPDSMSSLIFNVTNLTKAGITYSPATNHDPDADSNGTVIVVNEP